jgi:DNA polymerase III epsilon subunit-like protein
MTIKPKIMYWDIETSHVEAKIWSLYNINVNTCDITKDWFILCASYMYEGSDKVHSVKCTKKEVLAGDDKRIVDKLRLAVENADLIVAHNGDAFDTKKLKARIVKHRLPPLSFIKSIDTLKVLRREFKITSNKLDYACEFLGLKGKISNSPGLWNRVEAGDMKAMRDMVTYCEQDTRALRELYHVIKPHMQNHPNLNVMANKILTNCKACTSDNIVKNGIRYSLSKKHQKFSCKDCGHAFTTTKALKGV